MAHIAANAPRATYRMQLTSTFGFDAAAERAGYLARLGVSHLYSSPCLQAAAGSTHGYDVVDPTRLNDELGGPAGWGRLVAAARGAGLGIVLDIVPNHMAVTGGANPLWQAVLAQGPSCPQARFFDIDWDPPEAHLKNKVLLPVLGESYGQALREGKLRLRREGGRFCAAYYDHRFPLSARTVNDLLTRAAEGARGEALEGLAEACAIAGGTKMPMVHAMMPAQSSLPLGHMPGQAQDVPRELGDLLAAEPTAGAVVDRLLEQINADAAQLDALLEQQHYRLAHWRAAGRELNYRRFFDINTLVGLRAEDEAVFSQSHQLWLQWVREGVLDGLRVDHPDGLRDPKEYLDRLRSRAGAAWITVEKILEPQEDLPGDWSVSGTTGYDFLNQVGGLFVEGESRKAMTELYAVFTGLSDDFAGVVRQKKLLVLDASFGGELNRLADLLTRIAHARPDYRDCGRGELRGAVRQYVACLPVYRTYLRPGVAPPSEDDLRHVRHACQRARAADPAPGAAAYDLLCELACGRLCGRLEDEFVLRLQQLTGPAMAKGVEDTAFYCYNRLISLNEVGGDPGRFGVGVDDFHRWCELMQRRWPQTMLATSTHDTKRSEDVRLRIHLLSEMPGPWAQTVLRWGERNRIHRRGAWPDRNTEYMLYQTLVGAWPIDFDRLWGYLLKAVHETKTYTSWTDPDADYEQAVRSFAADLLDDREFIAELEALVALLRPAACVSSLAQTLIKLAAPGVPDFYQGTELWDLSLVDPDNRRPVDFDLRQRLLEQVEGMTAAEAMRRLDEGLPKLFLIRRGLEVRRELPEPFGPNSSYRKLEASGEREKHVVAFLRGQRLAAVAPRLTLTLNGQWGQTDLHLPQGRWTDRLTGRSVTGGKVRLGELLADFPVALLVQERGGA